MQQVYWQRVEAMRSWAVDALQGTLNTSILMRHQQNWDRGWLQHRAQEEGDILWAREWEWRQMILGWHVEALQRKARHGMLTQGKLEWEELLGVEGSARTIGQERASMKGRERTGWVAVEERVMLILTVEAGAARRRLTALPEHAWRWEGGGRKRWCSPREGGKRGHQCQRPCVPTPSQGRNHQPKLARDLFELQRTQTARRRPSLPCTEAQGAPEHRPGLYAIRDGRERGKKQRI